VAGWPPRFRRGDVVDHALHVPAVGGDVGRIVAMGFLGGLALSAVKRSLGAKDWGVMIEGHGGMLDRVDSVCFAAPVFFHLTRVSSPERSGCGRARL
jgi:hypothetical protein